MMDGSTSFLSFASPSLSQFILKIAMVISKVNLLSLSTRMRSEKENLRWSVKVGDLVIVEANYLPWKGLIIEEGTSDWDWLVYDLEDGSVWFVDDDELKPLSEAQ